MREKTCMVPTDLKEGKPGELSYERCGLPAKYQVGNWCVCEGHKENYTDKYKWPATPLEEE